MLLHYVLKRLLLAIPTLIIVSMISYVVIELPPGDFLTSYVMSLTATGEYIEEGEVEALKTRYGLDQPVYVRYVKWIAGVVRGDFGYSLEWKLPVKDLIWDRLLLTVVLSGTTMLFTWVIALPIGVFSATKQYSMIDYITSFLGFLGLGMPNFLLALILMWVAFSYFGTSVGGLFSPEFSDVPWTWARVADLLKHLWIPVVVLGTSGTAGLIRIMRANLLDELQRPYVETARAKGLPERRMLWKYPVRLALNPFVSTIGWALPQLVSGSTITSVVLNLATSGPLLLRALRSQDMYLAGSFLLMLSLLTVIGTFLSDALLALMDPRIRFT